MSIQVIWLCLFFSVFPNMEIHFNAAFYTFSIPDYYWAVFFSFSSPWISIRIENPFTHFTFMHQGRQFKAWIKLKCRRPFKNTLIECQATIIIILGHISDERDFYEAFLGGLPTQEGQLLFRLLLDCGREKKSFFSARNSIQERVS